MHLPRPPDWLIYAAAVAALLVLALDRGRLKPSSPASDSAAVGPASPFDPAVAVEVAGETEPAAGTAFSVDDSGVWVTARHVVDGCAQAAIVIGRGRGVEAKVRIDPRGEAAILTTKGGAPALPLNLAGELRRGERAYHPGYPQGEPGEATSRLLGRENLVVRGRGARTEPVLAWAEAGRTDGLHGTLSGLSGAPALDDRGRVIGVTIAEAPRRGRIYTTAPETVRNALTMLSERAPGQAAGGAITPDNYSRVADDLRRNLRVAQIVCLKT